MKNYIKLDAVMKIHNLTRCMPTIDTIYLIYGVNGGHAGSLPLPKDEMPKRIETGCQRNQINEGE